MSTLQGNTTTIESLLQTVNNLPAVGADDAVLYIDQTLTEAQKAQARTNIGAASEEEVAGKMDKITGTEDQVIGFDENGNPVAREAPSGGGVQPDWNQTDETAADFIKNKPFGEEVVNLGETLTWDGVVGERVVASFGDNVAMVRVSGNVPTADDVANGLTVNAVGGAEADAVELGGEDAVAMFAEDGSMMAGFMAFVPYDGWSYSGLVFEKKGVYFQSSPDFAVGVLTIPGYNFTETIVHKLDTKYIDTQTVFYLLNTDTTYLYTDKACTVKATKADVVNAFNAGAITLKVLQDGMIVGGFTPLTISVANSQYAVIVGATSLSGGVMNGAPYYTAEYTG